jgi:acetyl esterase/lipase
MSLPPLRSGHTASDDLLARRARMPAVWTAEMLEPGIAARDETIGGVPCLVLEPLHLSASPLEGERRFGSTILYFHGGGYRMGNAGAWANFGARLAVATGCRIVVADYRLAPEQPFPAAIHDAVAVHRALVTADGVAPVAAGDSAGGGLAAALPHACRAEGVAMPSALVLLSPWIDLSVSDPAYGTHPADQFFPRESALDAAGLYLQGHDAGDPLASPVKGDLAGFPPTLIFASADECLIGDAFAFQAGLADARVPVETHIVPGMTHVWPVIAPALPESQAALAAIGRFLDA